MSQNCYANDNETLEMWITFFKFTINITLAEQQTN